MKQLLKIVIVIVLIFTVTAIVAFAFYWYRNIHWYGKYEKSLKKVNAQEKQVTPMRSVIMKSIRKKQ